MKQLQQLGAFPLLVGLLREPHSVDVLNNALLALGSAAGTSMYHNTLFMMKYLSVCCNQLE